MLIKKYKNHYQFFILSVHFNPSHISRIIIGSTIYAVALHKQLTNVDGICCITFKLSGDIIKIITHYNKLNPTHSNIKK
jgi:hypothetical protein